MSLAEVRPERIWEGVLRESDGESHFVSYIEGSRPSLKGLQPDRQNGRCQLKRKNALVIKNQEEKGVESIDP